MNVIELSTKLNGLKTKFNTKHSQVEGKYKDYYNPEAAALKLNEERREINRMIASELRNLSEYIPETRNALRVKRDKKKFPDTSDREAQITTAYTFLNGNPSSAQIFRAIDNALSVNRLNFVSILLDHVSDNLSTFNDKDDKTYIDLILKQSAIHTELTGIGDVVEDLKEVDAIERRINHFSGIVDAGKHHFMFFADQKMQDYEIRQATEYLDSHPEIPVEERVALKSQMFDANEGRQLKPAMEVIG